MPPASPRFPRTALAALALAMALPVAPVAAQTAAQPDPAMRDWLLATRSESAPWLRCLATAAGGDAGRVWIAAAQARFARAARDIDADADWRRLADAARAAGRHRVYFRAVSVLSDEAYRRGDIPGVERLEHEALDAARAVGDEVEANTSRYGLALAAAASGRTDEAEALFRDVIARAEALGDGKGVGAAQRGLGRILEGRGQYAEAVDLQVSALERLLREGSPMAQSESYYSLARLFLNLEDYDAALRGADEAIRLMGDHPPDFPLGLNLVLRANVLRQLGRYEESLADAEAGADAFDRAGGPIGGALGALAVGSSLVPLGRGEEGLVLLRRGRAQAVELRERVLESDLALAEGMALVALQRPREALVPLRDALAIGDEMGLDRLRQDVSLELEKAYSALGQPAEALAASKRAYEIRTRLARLDQVAARSDGQARERFMALDPAPLPDPSAPGAAPAQRAAEPRLPAWAWLLVLPTLLLAWSLVRLGRHARRLRAEKQQIAARQQALESEHQALRQRVSVDGLTGALARQAFAAELEALLAHAGNHGRSVALLVFDLDNFKTINDQHGHLAGDEALRLVTGIAREKLRSDDLLGRFGGDEFLVACEGLDQAGAEALAERMRFDVVWRAPDQQPPMPGLSISVGVAVADLQRGYDPDGLFRRADAALYRAKRGGRNRVVGDDPAYAGEASPRRTRQWGDALAEP